MGMGSVLLCVAACGGTTVGQPAAAPTSASAGASSATPGPDGLPVGQPCSLLSPADLQRLGVTEQPTQEMVGTAHTCSLNTSMDALGVGIRTNVGLAGYTAAGGPVHDITLGGHQAKEELGNTGSCVVAIGVSASSRVDVVVTGDGTTDPCPTALTLARLVERRLPSD
ncbi:MAG TPA: DUF3558 family protein [Pseudonocardiaceae bacterium]|jgi:hypothetical protein